MEGGGQRGDIVVDARGVVFLGRKHDLGGESLQHADQLQLGGLGKGVLAMPAFFAAVHNALAFQLFQNAANAGVGVLHIVHWVVIVLLDGEVKVKIHGAAGLLLVKQETRAVNGHHIQQIGQADGLAAALAHAHGLAVLHQVHQLHQHHIQLLAVQANGIHSALHAGHMAVMVSAPNVNGFVKAAHGQFVVVIGNVGGKIGGNAVAAHQHFVLGLFLAAVVGLFLIHGAVFGGILGAAIHHRTVLGLVAGAAGQQLVHHSLHSAAGVQGAFFKPCVVRNAVFAKVFFHVGNVDGQSKVYKGLFQLGKGLALVQCIARKGTAGFHQRGGLGLVCFAIGHGTLHDIRALIAFLGQGIALLAQALLQIAHGQAFAEFLDLVAGIVQVELTGHLIARPVQHGGQTVTQGAAPGVAHVHGARGVGAHEFHIVFLAAAVVGAAVFGVGGGGQHHGAQPVSAGVQVDKAGACHLGTVPAGILQAGQVCQNGLGDHFGGLVPCAGTGHGHVAGHIAVFAVGRDLGDKGGQLGLGQRTVSHGGVGSLREKLAGLCQQKGAGVKVFVVHISLILSE